jgi:endonuclease III
VLREKHPNAKYELDWETPFQLVVATILAAQCTDERVNRVTKVLFPKYPDARSLADADTGDVETIITPTGAYRQKAKAIQGAAKGIADDFGGEVPRTVDELTTLPGVARKSANVVLNTAYDIPSGIIVDTHVARTSQRIGLSKNDKPELIEQDLMQLVPRDQWTFFGPALVLHGRYTCTAKAPQCEGCPMAGFCEKNGV